MVATMFFRITNVKEIQPDLGLTDQGLDSLGATQLISQLEKDLNIDIDTDILFDHPLYDQLVDEIYTLVHRQVDFDGEGGQITETVTSDYSQDSHLPPLI